LLSAFFRQLLHKHHNATPILPALADELANAGWLMSPRDPLQTSPIKFVALHGSILAQRYGNLRLPT